MTQSPNFFKIFVDYQDTDAGGVVYHGAYINFAERARAKMFREALSQSAITDYIWVVKHMDVNYKAPARLGDLVTLQTFVVSLGSCNITLLQKVLVDDKIMVEIKITLVSLNLDFKITKFAEYIKSQLLKYKI